MNIFRILAAFFALLTFVLFFVLKAPSLWWVITLIITIIFAIITGFKGFFKRRKE